MKLTYRGVAYQKLISYIKPRKTETVSKYRGQTYQITENIPTTNKPSEDLVYRGVSSKTVSTVDTEKLIYETIAMMTL